MVDMKAIIYRVLIVLSCIFLLENFTFSQETIYKLNWIGNGLQTFQHKKHTIKIEYLRFEGASFVGENMIPEYSKSILLSNYNNEQYQVTNEIYEKVPDSLLNSITTLLDLTIHLPKTNVYKARNDIFLNLNLSTLRYNPENGWLERLVQFQLNNIPGTLSNNNAKIYNNTKTATNSLLTTGYWYKIKVDETGIFKLTYSDLESMGFTNLSDVRIFGYGGRQLSFFNDQFRPSDLVECPIFMDKGADGIFNSGDYVLFYGEGPVIWDYSSSNAFFKQKFHDYSSHIFYFITTDHGFGKKIESVSNSGLTENKLVNSYTDYAYYERNLLNLIKSGRIWYTERIFQDQIDTIFQFSNFHPPSQVIVKAKIAGRSENIRSASLLVNDEVVDTESIPFVDLYYSWKRYAHDVFFYYSFTSTDSEVKVGVKYNSVNISDYAYLDYMTINARCQLSMNKDPFFFRDDLSVGDNNIARFVVNQFLL